MKLMKLLVRIVLLLLIGAIIFFGGLILYGTITDYRPAPGEEEIVDISGHGSAIGNTDTIFNLLNWNIGYGGLGKENDFFYDGGKTVRSLRDIWDKDFAGILSTILNNDSIQFYLIQEIDQSSKRSYFINQYDSIFNSLNHVTASFAMNYNVKHVPLPFTNPLGKVVSGVATFSDYLPIESIRFQYPGKFPWPTRIFFLDRCMLLNRYALRGGKELVVINTHNSAYDESGVVKKQEMDFLKDIIIEEYNKGNYVIVGGDFNQCPPGFDPQTFGKMAEAEFIPPAIENDFMPEGWTWAYDPTTPTNRHLETPLDEHTFKIVIDFYLLSPNIEMLSIKTIDQGFDFSDHQPVVLQVKLK